MQYADGTQMFLDDTEDSLKEALEILNSFYIMSGLRTKRGKDSRN